MTQANALSWSQALQHKLMAALDALWAALDANPDPAAIKQVRERARAIGDMAAMVRKVAAIVPIPRRPKAEAAFEAFPELEPALTQADHARRALEKLKGKPRGRL